MTDKRVPIIFSASVLAVLLLAFILPLGESGRIVAAILLLPAAVLVPLFVKKRNILSINTGQVILIMTVIAMVSVMAYYLTGLKFGFYKNPYRLSGGNFLKYFLPISAIIAFIEIIRYVIVAQKSRLARVIFYVACVISEMLICSDLPSVTSFNRFMDLVAGALFPAVLANLLYNYLSKRYGMVPVLLFRGITQLHGYVFAVSSGIAESLVHLFNILLPIGIFLFIDSLYEKRKKYALDRSSRVTRLISRVVGVIAAIIMIGTIMLVSNQFKYGSLVIATESMTGELNKGDVVIFESYDGQPIIEGQVIVFEKSKSMIVHRVIDIKIINGTTQYYTKGDANEDADMGFITDSDIVGLADKKIPFVGYPTIWLRGLFKR